MFSFFSQIRWLFPIFIYCLFLNVSATSEALILQMEFDGNVESEGNTSSEKIIKFGEPIEFSKGIKNQALVIQNSPARGVRVSVTNGFPGTQGTISFWVCPEDWKYDDGKFHIFLTLKSYLKNSTSNDMIDPQKANNGFTIYKYGNTHVKEGGLGILCLSRKNNKTNWVCNLDSKDTNNWIPGQWHFVVLTWNQDMKKHVAKFYIDSELIQEVIKPDKLFNYQNPFVISIGGAWGDKGKTSIDDLAVYSKALNEEDINLIYEQVMEKYMNLKTDDKQKEKP